MPKRIMIRSLSMRIEDSNLGINKVEWIDFLSQSSMKNAILFLDSRKNDRYSNIYNID